MTGEELTTSQWLEHNRSQFEQTGQLANRIGEQNQIYSDLVESGQLTVKPFQELASDYLIAEQCQTFEELIDTGNQAPYEELAERERALEVALGGAAAKLVDIEKQQEEETALIHREEELVAERLPELVPKLTELTANLERQLLDKAKQEAQAEITALQAELDSLEEMVDLSGRAWPIPRLVPTRRPEQTPEEELIDVDDFPESSKSPTRLTKQQIAERVRKNNPEEILRDASEFVALLLAEEPKHIFILEDLGSIIYGCDEPNRRVRISALISNFELGKIGVIGKTLEDYGLVFQRGQRKSYRRSDGKQFGRKSPVFRAVPLSEVERKERVVHCDEKVEWVDDGWHTVVFEHESTGTNEDTTTAPTPVSSDAKESKAIEETITELTTI